jgi:hypothetical protein
MKAAITFLIIIFSISTTYSQTNSNQPKKPGIRFVEKIHDFGPLNENTSVSHDFRFINTGTAPLLIRDVKAGCGCTTPKWSKQQIMPGDTGSITVEFRSGGFSGSGVHKSVTVMTNVPQNNSEKVVILAIKAFVKRKPLTEKGTK